MAATSPGSVVDSMISTVQRVGCFAGAAVVLALIAWQSPLPDRETDRSVYEATALQTIVPNCNELHCFRVLVAWTLGAIPGPSLLKWKLYAVISNAAAAVAVLGLCACWGLSRRAAWMAAFASVLGFGSLYTLYDVYTSDPLMFALAPIVVALLVQERVGLAAGIAGVGVLAKEFVVAPLFIFAATAWVEQRRHLARRALAAGSCAFIVWLTLQLTLILRYNYRYGENPSMHVLSGGYLAHWFASQTPRAAWSALFTEFGALWILAPAGWWYAPPGVRRFTLAALPVAALFAFVQQPDRALWNFHFVVTPLAALLLERVPGPLAWATLAAFALANLRVGAQLTGVPAARFALGVSLVLAVASLAWSWRAGAVPVTGVAADA